jgi:hypothetical protein
MRWWRWICIKVEEVGRNLQMDAGDGGNVSRGDDECLIGLEEQESSLW